MLFDFLNIQSIFKIYNGEWKGKGLITTQDLLNLKIKTKKTYKYVKIEKINNYTFSICIKTKCGDKITVENFLGFINKETGIIETMYPNSINCDLNFNNNIGINQFYFNNGYLMYSFSINKNEKLISGTIKLFPDNCKPKICSSSSSSSSSNSNSCSCSCHYSCSDSKSKSKSETTFNSII